MSRRGYRSIFEEPEKKKSPEELLLEEFEKLDSFAHGKDVQITDGREGWEACRTMTKRYDSQLYENWKDEVEKLLIFSGLFSAVVTTFVAQSYQLLQSDIQTPDTTINLLTNIALQLNRMNDPSSEVEIPAISDAEQLFSPSTANVWINALWFVSLVLSLSSALIGIVCVQWIRQYIQEHELSAKQWFKQRQSLCDDLEAWHVRLFIVSLPVILQLAVAMFFVGMVILLWGLSVPVAIPVTIVTAVPLIFISVTPFIPVLQMLGARYPLTFRHLTLCPYKTHQGLLLSKFVLALALGYLKLRMALLKRVGLSKTYLDLDIYSSIKSRWMVFVRLFGFHKDTNKGNDAEAAPENSAEKRIEKTTERRQTMINDIDEKYKAAKDIFTSWHWEVLDGHWMFHRSDPNADKLYPSVPDDTRLQSFMDAAAMNHDVVRSLVWLTKTFGRDPDKAFTILATLRSSQHHYDPAPVFIRVIEDLYAEKLVPDSVQAVKKPVRKTGDPKKDMKAIKEAAKHWASFKNLQKIKRLRLTEQSPYCIREIASALFLEHMTVKEWTNKRPVVSARVECFIRSTHSYDNDPEYPPLEFGADLLMYFTVGKGDMVRYFQTGETPVRWNEIDGIEGILLSLLYRFTDSGGLYKAENDQSSRKLFDSDFINAGRVLPVVCIIMFHHLESDYDSLKKAGKQYKAKVTELIRVIGGILKEYLTKNKIVLEVDTQAATSSSEPSASLQIEAPHAPTANPEPTAPISEPPLCDVSTLHNFIHFLHGFTENSEIKEGILREGLAVEDIVKHLLKIVEVINDVVLRINEKHSDHWYSNAETAACYSAWMSFKGWYNKYSATKLREELPPSTSPATTPPEPTPPDNLLSRAITVGNAEPINASDSVCTKKEDEDSKSKDPPGDQPVQSRWARFLRKTPADCFMSTMP